MDLLDNWGYWKNILGKAVDLGQTMGLSDHTITNVSEKIGTYLSNNVDPHNDEERLLKQLWDAASDEERKTLAKLVAEISDK